MVDLIYMRLKEIARNKVTPGGSRVIRDNETKGKRDSKKIQEKSKRQRYYKGHCSYGDGNEDRAMPGSLMVNVVSCVYGG